MQCGIVYCLSRVDCQEMAAKLANFQQTNDQSLQVAVYHGGLGIDERERVHRGWLNGHIQASRRYDINKER